MDIVCEPEPVLRRRAAPALDVVRPEDLAALVLEMADAMRAAPGVGLAAPQVGISARLFVMEDGPATWSRADPARREERERTEPLPFTAVLDPEVHPVEADGRRMFVEGCLSVFDDGQQQQAVVPRWRTVRLTGTAPSGEPLDLTFTGWSARIVQHEVDHLDGVLYVDRAIPGTILTGDDLATWAGAPMAELAAHLGFALPPGQA
ncbi:peptide deformylase [Aquihabitans sp. G128]|uniref:peptide deformylase n=1 Tax=Aquihabitans sp. G128 TaxID=2849779 RepID=UPI001C24919E|nr:peptide deformylase [Aquihabitans sp. G128]QXC60684.1 peptide deformylase [Aquihabitans sp. G128]